MSASTGHGVPRQELLRVAAALAGAPRDYDPERPGYCSAYPEGRDFRYEVAAALTMLAATPACADPKWPRATAGDTSVSTTGTSASTTEPSAAQKPAAGTDGLAALLVSCTKTLLN